MKPCRAARARKSARSRGLELGAPEVRVYPNRIKLADNNVTARQLSDTLDAYNDGLRVAEITVGNKRLDLMIKGAENQVTATQGIDNLPVTTPEGIILPASELADIVVTSGPTQINHLERLRTVTLEIIPPDALPLETALELLKTGVTDKLEADGMPAGVQLRLTGTADNLNKTWAHMKYDLLIAVVIVYLVMAVLFESFAYPLVIMLSVPLATAGGCAWPRHHEPVYVSTAGYADTAGLRDLDRYRRQQRDLVGASNALSYTRRGHDGR